MWGEKKEKKKERKREKKIYEGAEVGGTTTRLQTEAGQGQNRVAEPDYF